MERAAKWNQVRKPIQDSVDVPGTSTESQKVTHLLAKKANLKVGTEIPVGVPGAPTGSVSEQIAKKAGVSPKTVERLKSVEKKASPEINAKNASGEFSSRMAIEEQRGQGSTTGSTAGQEEPESRRPHPHHRRTLGLLMYLIMAIFWRALRFSAVHKAIAVARIKSSWLPSLQLP